MLVLSRRVGQRIFVGDNVVITIVRVGPNSVRIGIDAPGDMNIAREELVSIEGRVRAAAAKLEQQHETAEQESLAPV